jgi:hypothetical protein
MGRTPVEPTTPPKSEESKPPAGALEGLGADDEAGMMTAGKPDDDGLEGVSSGSVSGSRMGLGLGLGLDDAAGRGGRISISSTEEDEAGAGDGLRFPVPGRPSGTGVTKISCIDVTVLVMASSTLLLTIELDEVSGRGLRNGAKKDGLPNCLDWSCSELLED